MTCVYKEHRVKNGPGAMTTAKNEVFIGLLHEYCYLVRGGDKPLMWGFVPERIFQDDIFSGW